MNVRCLAQGLACEVVHYLMTLLSPPRVNKPAEEWSFGVTGKGSGSQKNNMPELGKEMTRLGELHF